jgi:hypothetical protein
MGEISLNMCLRYGYKFPWRALALVTGIYCKFSYVYENTLLKSEQNWKYQIVILYVTPEEAIPFSGNTEITRKIISYTEE